MSIAFWAKPQKSDYYDEDIYSGNGLGYGNFGYNSVGFPMILPTAGTSTGELGIALGMGRLDIFQIGTYGRNVYWTRRGVYGDGWHHYAVTINNGATPVVYLDGQKINPDASTGFATTSVIIASSLNFAGSYKGYSDDFFVYNRVLTTTEITQLYNMGR